MYRLDDLYELIFRRIPLIGAIALVLTVIACISTVVTDANGLLSMLPALLVVLLILAGILLARRYAATASDASESDTKAAFSSAVESWPVRPESPNQRSAWVDIGLFVLAAGLSFVVNPIAFAALPIVIPVLFEQSASGPVLSWVSSIVLLATNVLLVIYYARSQRGSVAAGIVIGLAGGLTTLWWATANPDAALSVVNTIMGQ